MGRRDIAQELQRKARVRRIVAAVIAVAVVAVVAGGVGLATFFGSVDGKMGLGDSDAKAALTAPKEGAWYALLAADLGAATATQEQEGPDALVLARVDASSRAVTLVSIPANLQVTLKDGSTKTCKTASRRTRTKWPLGRPEKVSAVTWHRWRRSWRCSTSSRIPPTTSHRCSPPTWAPA